MVALGSGARSSRCTHQMTFGRAPAGRAAPHAKPTKVKVSAAAIAAVASMLKLDAKGQRRGAAVGELKEEKVREGASWREPSW